MGVVYRATDQKLERTVALKSVLRGSDTREKARFEREAKLVAALAHPGIVTLYDVIEDGGDLYIVMELVEGRSLRAMLNEDGPLSRDVVARVIHGIADALFAAHERGLVHRDVKPDNVIVRADGRTALLDFGVAKVATNDTASPLALTATGDGNVVGTPAYLAPEQARGEAVSAATDQFALAVTAFELLTGELPWTTTSLPAMVAAIVSSEPAKNTRVDQSTDAILARGLSKDATARYPDVRAFARDLESALSRVVISSSSPPSEAASPLAVTAAADAITAPLPSAPPPSAAPTPDAPKAPSPTRLRLISVGAAAVVALTAIGVYALRPREQHTAATPEIATKPSVPTAALEYENGLDSIHHRSLTEGRVHFEKTLELDPTFVPAYVQAAISELLASPTDGDLDVELGRKHLAEAKRFRSHLSPRDARLVDLYSELVQPRKDVHHFRVGMEALANDYPNDADALFWTASAQYLDHDEPATLTTLRRVVTVDPSYGPAWGVLADLASVRHDDDAFAEALRGCLSNAPATAYCRFMQTKHIGAMGSCSEIEPIGREWLNADPDSDAALITIASGMLATDRPSAAVRDLIAKVKITKELGPQLNADVDTLDGRFAFASMANAVDPLRESGTQSVVWVEFLLPLASEAGDAATSDLSKFNDRLQAIPAATAARAIIAIEIAHREMLQGKRSRADFVRVRDETVVVPVGEAFGTLEGADSIGVARRFDHRPLTQDDARDFLSVSPTAGLFSTRELVAEAHSRLGHSKEVLALLDVPNRPCPEISDMVALIRSHLWVGLALEDLGQLDRAKAEYETVLAHWANATPPSRSAKVAQEHLAALKKKSQR
jgi:hypothetical protein